MVNIFITGATGYIGGDALYGLYNKHPEFSYVALVRTPEKAKAVTDKFPKVRTVIGDNDSTDLLKEESSKADIVIHTADSSDHMNAAKAIAAGLVSGHSKEKPGYWLHLGGTGILTYFDTKEKKSGESSDKVFNDWEGIDELVNLPHEAFHRDIDEVVIGCGTEHASAVKTAVVCPPTIYGVGRGPSLIRGRQAYELAKATIKNGKAPILGKGLARWNNVHLYDLTEFYLLLVEAAVSGKTDDGLWGDKGYYIIENGEHCWGDLSKLMGKYASEKGYISTAEIERMNEDEAFKLADFQALSWGLNSRARGLRARKLLNWSPKEGSLEEEAPAIVDSEYQALQKA